MPLLNDDALVRHVVEEHGGYKGQVLSFIEEVNEFIAEAMKPIEPNPNFDEELCHVQMSLDAVYYGITKQFRRNGSLQRVAIGIDDFKELRDGLIFNLAITSRSLLHSIREDKNDAPPDVVLVNLAYCQKLIDIMTDERGTHTEFFNVIVREKMRKHGIETEGWQ